MKIDRFDHIVITTENIDASVHFYVNILGMELDRSNDRYAVKFGNQKINLHRGKAEFLPAAQHVCFGSADLCLVAQGDIKEIFAELEEKKAPFVDELGIVGRTGAMGPIDSIYLRDPDGNLVEISVYRS